MKTYINKLIYTIGTCDSFQPGEYQITLLCGLTSAVVPIAIIDDDVFEDNEIFNVTIGTVTADPRDYNTDVSTGNPNSATVVIKNDEERKYIIYTSYVSFMSCFVHLTPNHDKFKVVLVFEMLDNQYI